MKKKKWIFFAAILLVCVLIHYGRVGYYNYKIEHTPYNFLEETNVSFGNGDIEELKKIKYEYGGLSYDGSCIYSFKVSENAKKEILKWDSLPFSDEAEEFIGTSIKMGVIPTVEEGTYYYINRSDTDIKHGSLAIYDSQNDIVYWYRKDI